MVSLTKTGRRYDALAAVWDQNVLDSSYGVAYIRRAIQACAQRRRALDIDCGTGGRLMNELLGAGFTVTGIDVSAGMLEIARKRHPSASGRSARFTTPRLMGAAGRPSEGTTNRCSPPFPHR